MLASSQSGPTPVLFGVYWLSQMTRVLGCLAQFPVTEDEMTS